MSKEEYLGEAIELKYPTIDCLARRIHQLRIQYPDKEIWLWKKDMDRAFRQLRVDPSSIPKLGYRWRGRYLFDLVLVMGCRISPYLMQRTSNMIAFIFTAMTYFVINYVDDYVSADIKDRIKQSHQAFIRLLRDTGASRSEKKSVPPTQILEFVGNLVNADQFTIGVTPERKADIMCELSQWRFKKTTNRKQLERLIGKLQFMSNCIRPGRLFVSRLLEEMKAMKAGVQYSLNNQARMDIKWWHDFLLEFKGTSVLWLLDCVHVDSELAVDACLQAAGEVAGVKFFSVEFPVEFKLEKL